MEIVIGLYRGHVSFFKFFFCRGQTVPKIPEDRQSPRKLSRRFPKMTRLPSFELGSASLWCSAHDLNSSTLWNI